MLALPALVTTLLALALATKPIGWVVVRYVPLANYVQFPWRIFLFADCTASLCAPIVVDVVLPAGWPRWFAAVGVTAALMIALGPHYGPPAPLVRVHINSPAYLRSIETDYVTSMNEYLPKTVRRTVPRFGEVAHVVSGRAALSALRRRGGLYSVHADALGDAILQFNAHWFPGWNAYVDGEPQSIGPGKNVFDDGGLIRVRIPSGAHDVIVRFARTRRRAVSDMFSACALLVTLGLFVRERWRRRQPRRTR